MVLTIPEFFAGQKVLVTGGTGFMGKVLVEKILRSCPQVSCIYLLLREKKGKTIEERWKAITELPLFDKLKSQQPSALKKVILIPCDMGKENVGLSKEHYSELIENVTLVYHGAAVVQFSENIIQCVATNCKSTLTIVSLARSMRNLKVFTYISTAYSNFNRPFTESVEKILPACQDWKVIFKLLETEPLTLSYLYEKLLCGHPNPYTWSKSLSEQIVNDFSCYFPTVVMRPGVVLGTLHEDPLVGWGDTLNGLSISIIAAGTGVSRVMKEKVNAHLDVVNVDIATRALMVAAKKAAETQTKGENTIDVYNCTYGKDFTFTYLDVQNVGPPLISEFPLEYRIWTKQTILEYNDVLFYIYFLIWQLSVDVLMDVLLTLGGKKRMFLSISKKVVNCMRTLSPFMGKEIVFPNENFRNLENYISEKDKQQFSLEVKHLFSVKDRIRDLLLGTYKYVLKYDISEESLKANRKRLMWFTIWTNVVVTLYYGIFALSCYGAGRYFFLS